MIKNQKIQIAIAITAAIALLGLVAYFRQQRIAPPENQNPLNQKTTNNEEELKSLQKQLKELMQLKKELENQ